MVKRKLTELLNVKNLLIAGIMTLSCVACAQENELDKARWLVGTWEMKTSRGSVYETWQVDRSNQLIGMSYTVNGSDTIVFERIRLANEKEGLFYIPAVSNQNDGKEVRFKGTSISNEELVFENPAHDFPQKIMYTLVSSDSLVAEISAEVNGETKKQRFPMKKL